MSWGGGSRQGVLTFLAALIALGAIAVPMAAAQTPAGVDQYQPTPPGGEGPTGGGGNENPNGGGPGGENPSGGGGGGENPISGSPGGTGDVGDGGGGDLPFTGYPLTTLVLIILALLVLGLALRALTARKRQASA